MSPRHMAPRSGLRNTVAAIVTAVVVFGALMFAMACTPVDGECGGETDCSEVRP